MFKTIFILYALTMYSETPVRPYNNLNKCLAAAKYHTLAERQPGKYPFVCVEYKPVKRYNSGVTTQDVINAGQ